MKWLELRLSSKDKMIRHMHDLIGAYQVGELLDMANSWLTLAFGFEDEKSKKAAKQKSKEVYSCLFLLWYIAAVSLSCFPCFYYLYSNCTSYQLLSVSLISYFKFIFYNKMVGALTLFCFLGCQASPCVEIPYSDSGMLSSFFIIIIFSQ